MGLGQWIVPLGESQEAAFVGGKAANLARLLHAGFPVPDGFIVTTTAHRSSAETAEIPAALSEQIRAAYKALGCPPVAVRSSATAEDLAKASLAGQYQTILDVQGERELLDAIRRCWASLDTERVTNYFAQHGLDRAGVLMGVVVQRLVPADVAGVLFTANPRTGALDEMLIEAAPGLGEAVVSGSVQPDLVTLNGTNGAVRSVVAGESGRPPCLTSRMVAELWEQGRRVAAAFGSPQDIEWACAAGKIWLLQARPITTLEPARLVRQCLEQTRSRLQAAREQGRGDWARHNISESLPQPTPLSWDVIRRFMSGDGGYGAMYSCVGFEPAPAVRQDGFLDLIAGRIYMDLARAPEMFFAGFPFRYDVDRLRTDPEAAQAAPTLPNGSPWERWRVGRKLAAVSARITALARDCDARLDNEVFPAFVQWVDREKQRDLSALSGPSLIDLWRERETRVMDEFAPQALLPSMIAVQAMQELRQFLHEECWDEDTDALVNRLTISPVPDRTILSAEGLREVGLGRQVLDRWVAEFGHRSAEELDLAAPRWRERPDDVQAMAVGLRDAASPLAGHHQRVEMARNVAAELSERLSRRLRADFQQKVALVQRYVRFREDSKHFWMLGYDLLRDLALEVGRRLEIGDDVFLLTLGELHAALTSGIASLPVLAERRRQRQAEQRVDLPEVIGAAEVAALGQPRQQESGSRHRALALSAGVCRGLARIVHSPQHADHFRSGDILVCSSTDPGWTPLFCRAGGLVLERGGTLSHGAVVARELGLPAVVLPGATRLLADGEQITIDADHGVVLREGPLNGHGNGELRSAASSAAGDPLRPDDTRTPGFNPPIPPPGRGERRAASLMLVFLLLWSVYFLSAFLLQETWVYQPTMKLFDLLLWPIVAQFGKPATVAAIAVALAALTMLGQRLLTDGRRLRLAKERAALRKKQASVLARSDPRRKELLTQAAPVQGRLFQAALVALAVLLGPLVMTFLWLPLRVDPASASARPGAIAHVTAVVDGEFAHPVELQPGPGLVLADETPARQSSPPIRATLERLRAKWRQSGPAADGPWDVQAAAARARQEMLASLDEYLAGPMPDQELAWIVRTPADQSDRFVMQLTSDGDTPVEFTIVLGDRYPPEPRTDAGDGKGPVQLIRAGGPIRQVRVAFFEQRTAADQEFFSPFRWAGWNIPVNWIGVYVGCYLPAMVLFRRLLAVP